MLKPGILCNMMDVLLRTSQSRTRKASGTGQWCNTQVSSHVAAFLSFKAFPKDIQVGKMVLQEKNVFAEVLRSQGQSIELDH